MQYPKLDPMSESEYKRSDLREQKTEITRDIQRVNEVISCDNEEALRELHLSIDGKYSAYVLEWGGGMYGYIVDYGFNYELLGKSSLIHNLKLMRAKLEGYAMNLKTPNQRTYSPNNSVNVNVSNSNEINISISFEDVRRQIEEMTSLTRRQTEEALEKVSEIESVVKGEGSKKTKWEKIKPVLTWLADKSFDVAMTILPLLLQIKV